ncbi:MAG TPA: caspase family protein [Cyclobacteriaceae bacterium]|nr:caspase family protein [Cytophagales bacterium]HMR56770.1 caspase family protein [Cyclobacteriaceae bacterium]HRE66245.1 caspase family protein [Cyclobacteriaceae bacterium]HRF34028.1 caspase family protein [Cyclobacteriaceae bacterium]
MRKLIPVFIYSLLCGSLYAQTLTWTSNELHLNFKESRSATSVPFITWVKPAMDYSSSQETRVAIEATVTDNAGLKAVVITIGNSTTGEADGSKAFESVSGNSFSLNTNVNLKEGTRYVEITTENILGVKVSSRRTLIVGKDALDYISADRKDIALIFATDNYDHWDDLVNPINDGQTIARELQDKYGFETEIITNATTEEVFEKIREYNLKRFKPQDQLLIFFAGHGLFDDAFGEGYVVAKNSLADDKSRTSYIAHARLRGIVNNIPCQHVLLMMDVCFGGTLDPVIARARTAADEVTEREMLARKLSYKTRKYLTSGGKEYVSDGIAGSHSPFAGKFLESLRSNGGDDFVLTLSEIQVGMEKLKTLPRFGAFGDDERLSDFVFVSKARK